ncbi:MAG: C69 family dipeptidase [Bacilli bacterium]|nr:C69 family dipeptidase [Bacilli bacterium]
MACTTILVGKKASYDGSTLIARNDDGFFDEKKLIVVPPEKQPKTYKSKIAGLEIRLPENPLRYTATPSVNPTHGIWAANGINEANVAMTATETLTSNPLVLGADPYVRAERKKNGQIKTPGGIGEEDLVVLVLPYIRSAREGVLRLGALLEQYGTYEPNGIAFSDENEIWWLETIGGHHYIARRVKDEEYVIMPNQFGIDRFDLDDAFGAQKEHLCSADLKEFIAENHLDLNLNGVFNPRLIFGSHSDADHVYNTPRAWFMARYFNPRTYRWDGENADFTPESDDIPWSLVPEHKITVEEVKYILSSYYQGTPYNPYSKVASKPGVYRPIGISRTGVMEILQIRPYVAEAIKGVEWLSFGSNPFNGSVPLYANVPSFPKYFSGTTLDIDTAASFFWASRMIGVLADANYGACIQHIERYQATLFNKGHEILNRYDACFAKEGDLKQLEKANEEVAKMAKEESLKTLRNVTMEASKAMKCGYSRADN